MSTAPASGSARPAIIRSSVVFPQPLGPTIETNSSVPTGEVHALQRDRGGVAVAGGERLADVANGDHSTVT